MQLQRNDDSSTVIYVRFQLAPSSGKLSELLAARPCDPRDYRADFPERWKRFIQAEFRSTTAVAVFFDVDEKTARHWWAGDTAPQGWVVSFARDTIPSASKWLGAA